MSPITEDRPMTDTTTAKTTEGFEEALWTYAGRRVRPKGGLGHLWLTDRGQEAFYVKVKGHVIGGSYLVQTDEARARVWGEPVFQANGGDRHQQAGEWDLEDRAAYNADQARLIEKRAADEHRLDELTLAQLRERLVTAPAARRTAMLAVILKRLAV